MVDDEDNIGAWVRGLRGRLDSGDSNGGTPVDWYVEFLPDNVASVDNLPPEHPMIAELLEYRQEFLDEFRWLRELIGEPVRPYSPHRQQPAGRTVAIPFYRSPAATSWTPWSVSAVDSW